jgi:hypothetical protein
MMHEASVHARMGRGVRLSTERSEQGPGWTSRAVRCVAYVVGATAWLDATGGCTAVLGMDAPGLADAAGIVTDAGTAAELPPPGKPATDAGSPDAPLTLVDSALGPGDDASAQGEEGEVPSLGVPCGNAASCSGASPVCCMGSDDAGGPTFQCITPADSCTPGYSVECDSDHPCVGQGEGCCHYAHSTKCVAVDAQTLACPGGGAVRVCDPRASGECGAGLSCQLVTSGSASPYYACQP